MEDPITLIYQGRVVSDPHGIIAGITDEAVQALLAVEATQHRVTDACATLTEDLASLHARLLMFQASLTALLTRPDPALQEAADRLTVVQELIEAETQKVDAVIHPVADSVP